MRQLFDKKRFSMHKAAIVLLATLITPSLIQAQETTYISTLGQPSTGILTLGSDSWVAAPFTTGNNASGYTLNSIQLELANATGDPSGLTAMLYSDPPWPYGIGVGSSLGTLTLDVSDNPSTSGIYTFFPTTPISLSSSDSYFIALTAATSAANGAYEWDYTGSDSLNVGWSSQSFAFISNDGLSWSLPEDHIGIVPQYAVTATPIPEPCFLALMGLSGLLFVGRRIK